MRNGFLALAGISGLLVSGCVIVPVPTSSATRNATATINSDDLAFVKLGETTRQQIESKLGAAWAYYPDLRISVHTSEKIVGRWYWMISLGEFGAAGSSDITALDVLFVAYSQDERVQRFQLLRHPRRKTTREAATLWATRP